jgi:carboxylesterase
MSVELRDTYDEPDAPDVHAVPDAPRSRHGMLRLLAWLDGALQRLRAMRPRRFASRSAPRPAWNPDNVSPELVGFAAPGRRLACLLIHGLGSTPRCMRDLADELVQHGIDVEAVLLPGHGTHPEDLQQITWADWYATVRDAVHRLRARADCVVVLGQSLGGTLALHAAAHEAVDGVITLAGVAYLRDWRLWFLPVVKPFKRWRRSPGNDVSRDVVDVGSYDRMPLTAIHELLRLARIVRSELASIRVPALIVHGNEDHVAPAQNADFIHQRLGSPHKEILRLEASYHVITLDHDRDLVARRVVRFIRDVGCGSAAGRFGFRD